MQLPSSLLCFIVSFSKHTYLEITANIMVIVKQYFKVKEPWLTEPNGQWILDHDNDDNATPRAEYGNTQHQLRL